MRVLIVVGGGFIGSHLARHHVTAGEAMQLLLRPTSNAVRIADLQTGAMVHHLERHDAPAPEAGLARIAEARLATGAIIKTGSGTALAVDELADRVAELAGGDHASILRRPHADPSPLLPVIGNLRSVIDRAPRLASIDDGRTALVVEMRSASVAVAA